VEEAGSPLSIEAYLAGTGNALEQRIARQNDIALKPIPSAALPRRWSELIGFPRRWQIARRQAVRLIDEISPQLIVGVGSYVSFPVAQAAMKRKIPLTLLEQNTVAGRTNRVLIRSAQTVFTPWPITARSFPKNHRSKIRCVGTPVREMFHHLPQPNTSPAGLLRLLVLGGSSGSDWINRTIPRVLANLTPPTPPLKVLHLAGEKQVGSTRQRYEQDFQQSRPNWFTYEILPFADDLPQKMHEADLAICRAGGSTLAELAAARLPAILAPLPNAKDDHQKQNALWLESNHAARRIETTRSPNENTTKQLHDTLLDLIQNAKERKNIARSLKRIDTPFASREIAEHLLKTANRGSQETKETS
jgi:UDP-N-acetylglucosamine--N-acetylmuramyl-(pentapeptide) pyrophosphoryl-undecaprenol N-acetylglucosamine transferase